MKSMLWFIVPPYPIRQILHLAPITTRIQMVTFMS